MLILKMLKILITASYTRRVRFFSEKHGLCGQTKNASTEGHGRNWLMITKNECDQVVTLHGALC